MKNEIISSKYLKKKKTYEIPWNNLQKKIWLLFCLFFHFQLMFSFNQFFSFLNISLKNSIQNDFIIVSTPFDFIIFPISLHFIFCSLSFCSVIFFFFVSFLCFLSVNYGCFRDGATTSRYTCFNCWGNTSHHSIKYVSCGTSHMCGHCCCCSDYCHLYSAKQGQSSQRYFQKPFN